MITSALCVYLNEHALYKAKIAFIKSFDMLKTWFVQTPVRKTSNKQLKSLILELVLTHNSTVDLRENRPSNMSKYL